MDGAYKTRSLRSTQNESYKRMNLISEVEKTKHNFN